MDKFNLYAKYYNLLYKDKDYTGEVEYIDKIISSFSQDKASALLDLGCGTGIHADLFSERGYIVDGVDLSEQMIAEAKENYSSNSKLRFFTGNINDFRIDKKYEVVTSLFHVISYQNSNNALLNSFKTAAAHLDKDGLFIFDFWYGPGVLTDLPTSRVKELENEEIKVKRSATPVMHNELNVVDVNYNIEIVNKVTKSSETIDEKHSMRYLFRPEIENYLQQSQFKLIGFYHWLSFDAPGMSSWNGVAIAKKYKHENWSLD